MYKNNLLSTTRDKKIKPSLYRMQVPSNGPDDPNGRKWVNIRPELPGTETVDHGHDGNRPPQPQEHDRSPEPANCSVCASGGYFYYN